MARAFASRAESGGAEVCQQTPARDIELANGRVDAVVTDRGAISTPIVVIAAGPWAKEVGRWAGLELPLEISREQDMVVRSPAGAPPLGRVVSDMVSRTYFRPDGGGLVLAGTGHPKENEPVAPDSYRRDADQDFIDDLSRRLTHRLPAMEGASLVASWAGLYTITPDWNMILDRAPSVDGLYLAVGGSGHSFKLAPAMGLCLAELIVDGEASTVDIAPLRAARFDESDLLFSTYGGNRA